MSKNSTRKDDTERGPKPMSDEEIRESTMGQNTSYLDKVRGASKNSYGKGNDKDSDDY